MPDAGNAILDIALTYAWDLHTRGFDIGARFNDPLLAAADEEQRKRGQFEALQTLEDRLGKQAQGVLDAMIAGGQEVKTAETFDDSCITVDARTFIALRWAAWAMGQHPKVPPQQRVILSHVRKNSDQIKNVLLRLYGRPDFDAIYRCSRASLNRIGDSKRSQARDALQLDAKDMTLLPKTWEIGVQEAPGDLSLCARL